MKYTRHIGFILLLAGIALKYIFEWERMDLLSGMLFGMGIALILLGRAGKPKN